MASCRIYVIYGVFGTNKFCGGFSEVCHYIVLTRADSCSSGWCALALFGDTLFVIFSDEISPCAVSKDQACGSIVVSCRGTLGCDACEP